MIKKLLYPPEPLLTSQWQMLLLLGATLIVNQYDVGVLVLALPKIQATFNISEADIGQVLAITRFGELPAILLAVFADRFGRRLLLMITVVGFMSASFVTAFVNSIEAFIAAQLLAKFFISAEYILSIVVIIESLDAKNRGWGIGVLAAFGALGHGLGSLAFGFVDWLPFGWRALYVISVVPLFILAILRSRLKETHYFSAMHLNHQRTTLWQELKIPLVRLFTVYPQRLMILGGTVISFWFCMAAVVSFIPKHLQAIHHYTPGDVALLYITGGTLAIFANIISGKLSDTVGRRNVLLTVLLLLAVNVLLFFNVSSTWVPVAWVTLMVAYFCSDVILTALSSELFPTSYRSTAAKAVGIIANMGAIMGLLFEGLLYQWTGSHAAAISVMMVMLVMTIICVYFFIPETATQNLDAISPEKLE